MYRLALCESLSKPSLALASVMFGWPINALRVTGGTLRVPGHLALCSNTGALRVPDERVHAAHQYVMLCYVKRCGAVCRPASRAMHNPVEF